MLGLGLWPGKYRGKVRQWLRWYDAVGNWIPSEPQKERREKELAQARVEGLAERLRQARIEERVSRFKGIWHLVAANCALAQFEARLT